MSYNKIYILLFAAPIIGYNLSKLDDYFKNRKSKLRYTQLKESGKFEKDFKLRFPHLPYRK